jgi:heme-binding NEAT domain protein
MDFKEDRVMRFEVGDLVRWFNGQIGVVIAFEPSNYTGGYAVKVFLMDFNRPEWVHPDNLERVA